MAEADGHLQQRIKQLLKLSKEKWDAACGHAKTAVQVCSYSDLLHFPLLSSGEPIETTILKQLDFTCCHITDSALAF